MCLGTVFEKHRHDQIGEAQQGLGEGKGGTATHRQDSFYLHNCSQVSDSGSLDIASFGNPGRCFKFSHKPSWWTEPVTNMHTYMG